MNVCNFERITKEEKESLVELFMLQIKMIMAELEHFKQQSSNLKFDFLYMTINF